MGTKLPDEARGDPFPPHVPYTYGQILAHERNTRLRFELAHQMLLDNETESSITFSPEEKEEWAAIVESIVHPFSEHQDHFSFVIPQ
jgi:hypothetical protein